MSLLELMEWFHPGFYIDLGRVAEIYKQIPGALVQEDEFRINSRKMYQNIRDDCRGLSLAASVATLDRILELLNREPPGTYSELQILTVELNGRLIDEMHSFRFLSLSLREAEEYREPWKGWEGVMLSFPSAVDDIFEATRCLALGRNTAAVFHLMRMVEVGLRCLGKALNDEKLDPRRNPSWDAILSKCEKELAKPIRERSPEWHEDETFFAAATANLRAVQYAWRNPTLHVERSYGDEEAREISAAVRGFVRHLATKLSEAVE